MKAFFALALSPTIVANFSGNVPALPSSRFSITVQVSSRRSRNRESSSRVKSTPLFRSTARSFCFEFKASFFPLISVLRFCSIE